MKIYLIKQKDGEGYEAWRRGNSLPSSAFATLEQAIDWYKKRAGVEIFVEIERDPNVGGRERWKKV